MRPTSGGRLRLALGPFPSRACAARSVAEAGGPTVRLNLSLERRTPSRAPRHRDRQPRLAASDRSAHRRPARRDAARAAVLPVVLICTRVGRRMASRVRSAPARECARARNAAASRARGPGARAEASTARRTASTRPSHGSAGKAPAQAQLQPATCEDASTPVREADGSYACADGSEPACTDGAEPVAAGNGSDPVCPATAAEVGGVECEDGSVQGGATGSSGCDEGSQPECEDGSQPTLSEDGWTLECPLSAEAGTVRRGRPAKNLKKRSARCSPAARSWRRRATARSGTGRSRAPRTTASASAAASPATRPGDEHANAGVRGGRP